MITGCCATVGALTVPTDYLFAGELLDVISQAHSSRSMFLSTSVSASYLTVSASSKVFRWRLRIDTILVGFYFS
jgi:hypothetical protein